MVNTEKKLELIRWRAIANPTLSKKSNGIWPYGPALRSPVWSYGKFFHCILVCWSSPLIWYATWPCSENWSFDPPVSSLGHDPGDQMKIPSKMFCIFHLWEDKVWFKNIWNWHSNWNLMIFDLQAPPQGPRGWWPKNCAVACAIHVSNSHTKFGWILKKNLPATPLVPPLVPPQARPQGHDPGDRIKIQFVMFYIFHLWEDTQSLV